MLNVDYEQAQFEYPFGFGGVGDVVDREKIFVVDVYFLYPLIFACLSIVAFSLVLYALVR